MKILVINSGSSSIKFQLFNMTENISIAKGIIEQIGKSNSSAKIEFNTKTIKEKVSIENHESGLRMMNTLLLEAGVLKSLDELSAIGHRVVHGGERFSEPIIVDSKVLEEIENLIPLAPLHNRVNLYGIKATIKQSPRVTQVAVFDTSFHASIPDYAYMYALPYEAYKSDGVRRYGFHGTSHHFVSKLAAKYLGVKRINAVTLHLGNGASAAAIKNGRCIDTSMGFTPLEGLMMGTRSGDLDPAILIYLARKNGLSIDDLDRILNKESGLKGICGSSDMREIQRRKENNDKAKLALEMFSYRIKKYIGSYCAVIGEVDCIVFTGGIGENDTRTRQNSCEGLEHLGIELDLDKNNKRENKIIDISSKNSKIRVLVIPTNEELEIAIQVKELLGT